MKAFFILCTLTLGLNSALASTFEVVCSGSSASDSSANTAALSASGGINKRLASPEYKDKVSDVSAPSTSMWHDGTTVCVTITKK